MSPSWIRREQTAADRSLYTLLSAYSVSQVGNWLFRTGVVYRAYNQKHGSTAVLTTAIVLVYLPILFGSRLLAPQADRRDTRRTLIGLDVLRGSVLTVLLAVVGATTAFTSGSTIAVLAFLSVLTPFFTASQTAYLRRILPTERIPSALAAVSKVEWTTFIIGTAAAPLLLQVSNLPTLIVLDIGTFVVSGLLLVGLVPAPGRGAGAAAAQTARLSSGTRQLLVAVFMLNVGAGLINVYPNVATRDFLGGGAALLSVFNFANGCGGVVGATIAGRVRTGRGLRPGVAAAAVISVALVCMTFVGTVWAAVAASSVLLMAGQVFAVGFQTRMLEREPVEVAGRVSGFFTLGTFGGVTLSILLFLGATQIGSTKHTFQPLVLTASGAALAACGIGLLWMRRHGDVAVTTEPSGVAAVADDPVVDGSVVRRIGRTFATGVAVASSLTPETTHATTVNAVATLSLDPPLVLVCVGRESRLLALLRVGSPLGLSILSADQHGVARYFADDSRPAGPDQFDGHPWHAGPVTGVPLLDAGVGRIEARVTEILPGGDHGIVVARVLDFAAGEGQSPLVFHGGGFHDLAHVRETLPVASASARGEGADA